MVVALLPLVAVIVTCYYLDVPHHLLYPGEQTYPDSVATYRMVVTHYPVERAKTWRVEGKHIWLYLQKDSSLSLPEPGDTLLVRTRLHRPDSIGSFDYGTYLRRQHIYATGYVPADQWTVVGHGRASLPIRWQHALMQRYMDLGIQGDELATLSALSLGYRENLDQDLKQSFQRAGAMHVLAVSGLHTGILAGVVLALLTCFGRCKPLYHEQTKRRILALSIMLLMWIYAAMTGWSPSVVRSVIMLSVAEIGIMLYRDAIGLNTLAASAVLILLVRPLDLFSVSFQLSYAAVAGLLIIPSWLIQRCPIRRYRHRWVSKAVEYLRDLILVSLAAQLATLPLTLYYFHQVSNYFLLTNLVAIPLAGLILSVTLAMLTIGWIPAVGTALAWVVTLLTRGLNSAVGWIEHLPGSTSQMECSLMMTLCLYIALVCGIVAIGRDRRRWILGSAAAMSLFVLLYLL